MKRQLYKDLLIWKENKNRKPLLLQGARQVGKTYLLKEFGREEYSNIAYFNFEQTPELTTIFDSSLMPHSIIETLSAYIGFKINPFSTLIFFDEIQDAPRVLTSLKYFLEEAADYHIVAAGSLLGVSIGKSLGFPIGKVNFLELYPMSFLEYLNASGNFNLIDLISNKKDFTAFPDILHNKLLDLYKYFLFLGGMPEVISNYIQNKDIREVRIIQNDILKAYVRDFSKYSSSIEALKILEIWKSIPLQIAKENKKFTYKELSSSARASKYSSAVEWLNKAGLIYISNVIKAPKLPLDAYIDSKKHKIFLFDTGLLAAMLKLSSSTIVHIDKLFSEYNGAFIENFVATTLVKENNQNLYYWTSNATAEVDFIVPLENEIRPLEVKSGLSRNIKSLNIYSQKYNPTLIFRTSPRNFTQDNNFINIPLYCVELITKL